MQVNLYENFTLNSHIIKRKPIHIFHVKLAQISNIISTVKQILRMNQNSYTLSLTPADSDIFPSPINAPKNQAYNNLG